MMRKGNMNDWLSELMLLSIVGRGGIGIRTTNGKNTLDTKHISAHGSTHDQSNHVQIQPTPSPLHCNLEHIRIPSTKLCVCARAREHVCVIFILKVVFRKLSFIKYMGGIMLKEALLFLFFFFFSFFLITSNIYIIGSSSFYSRRTRKIKKKEELKQ